MATYGHRSLTLARIGNRIVADNQRRMFAKLLQQNIGFFADRHCSEFIARLTTGAAAANQVLNLLITSIGRDLLSLIGLARRHGCPGSGHVAVQRHRRAAGDARSCAS